MTDLEKLWDDLPTGPAPVEGVLGAGRRLQAARRRRLVARPVLAVGGAAALVAAFLAGTEVGGPGASTPPTLDARPAAFRADLDPASSCTELLQSYRDRGVALVSAWGWGGDVQERFDDGFGSGREIGDVASPVRAQASSETGTNVQETGVDEPDTVKTDGSRIVRLRGSQLEVHDASGQTVREVSTLHLPRLDDGELLLDGDTVVTIGADRTSPRDLTTGGRRGSRVVTISLSDPAEPAITSDVTYSSRVLSVRQHGSVVRLVLAAGLPDLDFVRPQGRATSTADALATNRRIVEESTLDDWSPTVDAGDGPRRLVDCTDVAIPSDDLGLDTVSIVGLDTAAPTEPRAIGLAGAATIAYESADHLFLASSPSTGLMFRSDRTARSAGTSHVFDFELDGVDAAHVASGEIEGDIADRWSLDEADDVLRVAVGASSETGRFNSVVTLRRTGDRLVEIGRVDGLGPDEQIKGVRWFDDLAVVVTYREVDPLYTVDLSAPDRPRLLGRLKIPGFSDYLHPLGDDRLLGVGFDDRGSAQIALFDVSDLTDVRRTDVVGYPRSEALAAYDPRSFTWLPDRDTVLTVVRRADEVDLATIVVGDDSLDSSVRRVEYGADAVVVRTVELSDGRVALVTGEEIGFLPLP